MQKLHKINRKNVGLGLFGVRRFFVYTFVLSAAVFFVWIAGARGSVDDLRSSLQQDLDKVQAEINQYRAKINVAQTQGKTLKREMQLLTDKGKELELQIKQTDLILQQTQLGINDKTSEIEKQEVKLNREKALLAQYLQGLYEIDQSSMLALVFSQKNLSDIFGEMNSLETLQRRTYDTISEIKITKKELEDQKQELSDRKEEELQLKSLQQIQRGALRLQQAEKDSLLKQTKGEETAYQALLKKATADATAIRKQIYMLEGVGLSMTLEDAYKHAKFAADRTGVRPAFLLAVLKQESSWGTNVGKGTWKKDMRVADQKAFVQICDELNLDPDQMPVSRRPSYGWGGAMGPAQFLPTTWLAYKDRVAALTGHNPPSPWDIDDAFTAAALKLANAGANQRTADIEWKAAMIYFAGNNWGKAVYSFYGDSVMELARVIQEQLDIMLK
ncbi:MAG: lytic murein transglycosylase [bacterium]